MSDSEMLAANASLRDAVLSRLAASGAAADAESCCAGGRCHPAPAQPIRPGSLGFMEAIEEVRQMHLRKSQDYGAPTDPLANVRGGAELVGIEAWRSCLVRVADKVQRIKTFCRDGRLTNESVEDTLLDLASYSLIALVLFRESK